MMQILHLQERLLHMKQNLWLKQCTGNTELSAFSLTIYLLTYL